MATIRTSIQIQDNMSRAFQAMNSAMSVTLSSFEALHNASSQAVDTASIQLARQELARAGAAFDQVEDEIRQANAAQQGFNNEIRAGTSAADGLLGKLLGIAAAYLSFQSAKGVVALSDEMTSTTARLDLMNYGLQTTAELQDMIFESAKRTYVSYQQTADMVGKLGMQARDAFSSNQELIAFAEQINKTFTVAGTSAEGVSSVMLQLTQAMAAGKLQGEELNAILDNTQPIVQNIADYMEVPVGSIKELASKGQISAEIIKNAMFAAADATNAKFETMPVTFAQIWTNFKNDAFFAFQPILKGINDIANNEKFQNMMNNMVNSLYMLSDVAMGTFDVMASAGGFVYDNWSLIGPVIGALTFIMLGYVGALGVVKLAEMAAFTWKALNTTATLIYAAAMGMGTGATWAMVAATWGLNAALAANPIFLIIMATVALIGVFYLAVAAINHFAGTSISATGIVAGTFMVLATVIRNRIVDMWNVFASFWEFFANISKDKTYAVKMLFYNLASNVLDQAIAMSSGWDKFATNFVNSIVDAVNAAVRAWNWFIGMLPDGLVSELGWGVRAEYTKRESITSDLQNIKGALRDWVGEAPDGYWEAPRMEAWSIGGAWDAGYNWGDGLFDRDLQQGQVGTSMDDILNGIQGALDPLTDDGKKTAGNTAKMAKSMEGSAEDLKYMRDMSERDAINRYTTAEIKVDMSGMNNNINNEMDIDGIVSLFGEKVEEVAQVIAEGDDYVFV